MFMIVLQQELQIVISCRPVRVGKSLDSAENVSMLGAIMSRILEDVDNMLQNRASPRETQALR